MGRNYGNWNDTLGNNFTDNGDFTKAMMLGKNWETQGSYQAEVSGMYGEFTIASVFKALPDEYAILNDILIQTGVQYRKYGYNEFMKYGPTPWALCNKIKRRDKQRNRVFEQVQQVNKDMAYAMIKSNCGVYFYEQVKQSSQLDHVIVSPYGIFVIETKNHKGMIWGDMNGKVWTETFLSAHHTFYNPVFQNEQHLNYLSKATKIGRQYMAGFLVFTNPQADLSNVNCSICMRVEQLANAITYFNNPIWNEKEKDAVIARIEKVNSSSYTLSKEHVTFVKDLQHRMEINKAYRR